MRTCVCFWLEGGLEIALEARSLCPGYPPTSSQSANQPATQPARQEERSVPALLLPTFQLRSDCKANMASLPRSLGKHFLKLGEVEIDRL